HLCGATADDENALRLGRRQLARIRNRGRDRWRDLQARCAGFIADELVFTISFSVSVGEAVCFPMMIRTAVGPLPAYSFELRLRFSRRMERLDAEHTALDVAVDGCNDANSRCPRVSDAGGMGTARGDLALMAAARGNQFS